MAETISPGAVCGNDANAKNGEALTKEGRGFSAGAGVVKDEGRRRPRQNRKAKI